MNEIYSRQLGYLLFIFLLGSALIYVPESIVTQDVWISTILASFVGLYLLHILLVIQGRYPGLNIMQICELIFGKVIGKILNLVFLWSLLMVTILILFDTMLFIQLLYPEVPNVLITSLLILSASYVVFKGSAAGARLVDFYIWFVVILVITGFAVLTTVFEYKFIPPILSTIKPVLGGAIYGANWPFAELIVIALYLPLVVDLDRNKRKVYFWFALAALVLAIRSFLVLGVIGAEYLSMSRFPFYDILLIVQFQEFERIELFFFALFITLVFGTIIVTYRSLTLGVQHFFGLGDNTSLIFPIGLLIIALMYNSFPSDIKYLATQARSIIFVTLPFHLLYPTIILIASKIKMSRKCQGRKCQGDGGSDTPF